MCASPAQDQVMSFVTTVKFRGLLDDGRTVPITSPRTRFPSQADAEAAAQASVGRRFHLDSVIELWLSIASEFGGSEWSA
jgi:hypothetical protein